MGYSTDFSGKFDIEPAVSFKLFNEINDFSEIRHEGAEDVGIGIWCDWVIGRDGNTLEWNGSEKTYDSEKWVPYLIERFLKPAGHVVNGSVKAQGEDMDDRWKIVIVDNVVEIERLE